MKKFVMFFVVLTGMVFMPVTGLRAATLKIAVVDLNTCLRNSNAGKKLASKLEKLKNSMQKKIEAKQKELIDMQQDLQKQGMMLSDEAREDKQKKLERMQREYKYFVEDLRNQLRREETKGTKKILLQLQEIINDMGEKGHYSLILEKRAGVLFNDPALDITDKVIAKYDSSKR